MERGKSIGFTNSTGEVTTADCTAAMDAGSRKAIEASSERSESWQQDIVQAVIPDISCPQSI